MPSSQTPVPNVIRGNYLGDMLAQGDALKAVAQGLSEVSPEALLNLCNALRGVRRIVLTGMGSSHHALYPLHLKLSAAGLVSHWIETSELLLGFEPFYAADTLLVAVSQSGESGEIVRLLEHSGRFGHIVGVTNNPVSTLGRKAHTVLQLHAGVESTVSCKTYLATLAALHWLSEALTGGDLAAVPARLAQAEAGVRDYLARWESHVAEIYALTEGVQSFFITGRATSMATAGTGGLIFKEATRRSAEGMGCAAFRHGPLEMVSDKVLVLVCAGDGNASAETLNRRLADDIVKAGGRAVVLGAEPTPTGAFRLPSVPAALLPIVEILPVQMLTLALAARDGREAGRFERASKITTAI